MKIPFVQAHIFWIPWWDVDHHMYGCPIQITLHTPTWGLMVRPFSSFAQGGNTRGMTDFHDYERSAKWLLDDENPRIWTSVQGSWEARGLYRPPRTAYCVVCLHDVEGCTAVHGKYHETVSATWAVFPRHLWLAHAKGRKRCRIKWREE